MKQQASSAPQTEWREDLEGSPYPLGATLNSSASGINFALYSKHATNVELLIFSEQDLARPIYRHAFDLLVNKSGPIWHCNVPFSQVAGAKYYGYQIAGPPPAAGFQWHAFDPAKLLLDPYARAVYFPPQFSRLVASQPGSNLGRAPLGMLDPCTLNIVPTVKRYPAKTAHIIYELHVRGFTRRAGSGVAEVNRGTYAGMVEKIPYLRELGITAVELMPVFQFDPQENDYWGYMPLNFFSPHQEYASQPTGCSPHGEFRELVGALHAADIEVILDVVYNHTCEGDETGPCYSFKGIDNSSYYLLTGDSRRPYANYSGTGNTLHTANRATRRLIVDSLRYWVNEMGIDGFRFDLASIFSRRSDGSIDLTNPPIFDQIAGNAAFGGIHLIAEPWDAGGLYQLGLKQANPAAFWGGVFVLGDGAMPAGGRRWRLRWVLDCLVRHKVCSFLGQASRRTGASGLQLLEVHVSRADGPRGERTRPTKDSSPAGDRSNAGWCARSGTAAAGRRSKTF